MKLLEVECTYGGEPLIVTDWIGVIHMQAAFEALHEEGEIDDQTVPFVKLELVRED